MHLAVIGKKPAANAGLDATIRAVQKKLGVFVDGNPGPETWGAIHLAVVHEKPLSEIQSWTRPRSLEKAKQPTAEARALLRRWTSG